MRSRACQLTWPLRSVAGPALALLQTAVAPSCTEPESKTLAWTGVASILDPQPATGPERELNVPELLGKRVTLPLTFVGAEQDDQGKTRHVYRCTAGNYAITCFVKGPVADKGSGTFTGRITRARFVHADLRGIRTFLFWLDADTFTPAP